MYLSPFAAGMGLALGELAAGKLLGCDRLFARRHLYWNHLKGGGKRQVDVRNLAVLLNILVNFLLLVGTNRLSGFPAGGIRGLLGALLGGIWSGACLLTGFGFLGNRLWRTVRWLLMGSLAFGWEKEGLKRCGIFLLLAAAVEMLAACMGKGDRLSLILGLLLALALGCFSYGEGIQTRIPVTLTHDGKTLSLTALRDTGNTLRDPVSGDPVLVICPEAAMKLTGLSRQQLRCPLETLLQRPIPGLRLIPYRAVGQESGMLLGARIEDVRSRGRMLRTVVAFAPEGLGTEDSYQALTGGYV